MNTSIKGIQLYEARQSCGGIQCGIYSNNLDRAVDLARINMFCEISGADNRIVAVLDS